MLLRVAKAETELLYTTFFHPNPADFQIWAEQPTNCCSCSYLSMSCIVLMQQTDWRNMQGYTLGNDSARKAHEDNLVKFCNKLQDIVK